jgi:hypothetical protein
VEGGTLEGRRVFGVGSRDALFLVMKKKVALGMLAVAASLVSGCAGESAGVYDAESPATVDTSWVDDQRAEAQRQAEEVQRTVDLQHEWDDFHAAQLQQQQDDAQRQIDQQRLEQQFQANP